MYASDSTYYNHKDMICFDLTNIVIASKDVLLAVDKHGRFW